MLLPMTLGLAAHADPEQSQTVWNIKGRAVFTPSKGIFWFHTDVKEVDGTNLSISCQSGPFTPYAVDGRVQIEDIHQGKPDQLGRPGPMLGVNKMTRVYANGADDCEKVVRWFADQINQRGGNAQIVLNDLTGDVTVGDLN